MLDLEMGRWLMVAIGLLLVGVCKGAVAADQALPAVCAEHPRLLVTQDDLARLKQQAAAYPEEWRRMQELAAEPPDDPGYGDARGIRTSALVYLVTGEERYLRSTVARAENIARNHKLDQYATPEAVFGLALAYDWCYPGLSQSERQEMAEAVLRMAQYCQDKIWRHSDFNNHFVLEKVWPFVYTGLALHGDVNDPRVDEFLKLGDSYLHANLIPTANLMAAEHGGQHEGYGYDLWGYARPMAFVMEAWRTAVGEDLFPVCTATRNFALWNIYGRRPFDGKQEHFDDAGLDLAWGAEDAYAYLFAARYQDGRAQWMGDQMTRRYDAALWPILLWRDPDLKPQAPGGQPLTQRFESLGWVLMRSSWGEDATFASFQCGPFLTGHQHLDNNAFTIHKNRLLAIDPGINAYGERIDDGYRTNYYSRTIAHNSITVYDPGETFPDGAWAGGHKAGAANDGGQLRLGYPQRIEEVKPGGEWDAGRRGRCDEVVQREEDEALPAPLPIPAAGPVHRVRSSGVDEREFPQGVDSAHGERATGGGEPDHRHQRRRDAAVPHGVAGVGDLHHHRRARQGAVGRRPQLAVAGEERMAAGGRRLAHRDLAVPTGRAGLLPARVAGRVERHRGAGSGHADPRFAGDGRAGAGAGAGVRGDVLDGR